MKYLIFALTLFNSLAHAELIDIDQLYSSPDFQMVSLSPEGQHISYVEKIKNGYLLNLYDNNKHQSFVAYNAKNGESISSYHWLNETNLLVKIRKQRKIEEYLLSIDSSNSDDEKKISKVWIDRSFNFKSVYRADTSKYLIYVGKKRKRKKNKIALLSIEQLRENAVNPDVLFETSFKQNEIFYDEESESFIAWSIEDDTLTTYQRLKNQTAFYKLFSWEITKDKFLPIGYLDENNLLVLSNQFSDKVAAYAYNFADNKFGDKLYEHERYDLTYATALNGKLNSIQFIQRGLPHIEYLSPDFGSSELQALFKDKKFTLIASNLADNKHVLFAYHSDDPGAYYFYDSITKDHFKLMAEKATLENASFARSTEFTLTTDDGLKIESFFTKPRFADRNTLIVMPHGGPVGVRDFNFFDRETQYLANRGYSVLRVNFRGSSGFGKNFKEKGIGELGRKIEEDITQAVEHILEKHEFNHICAYGNSYGAYSAVMLAIQKPARYQCVIAGFGIYDVPLLFNSSNFYLNEDLKEMVEASVGKESLSNQKPSPVLLAEKLQAPILLIAGKKDKIAYFEHSNRFKYVLKKHGKDVENIFYNHAGHGLNSNYGEKQLALAITDFIERKLNLPPISDLITDSDDTNELSKNEYALLADLYSADYISQKSDSYAFNHYLKAADLGHTRAMFNVGSYYHRGDFVEQSDEKAMDYYLKSAEAKNEKAYSRLAAIYMQGSIAEQDYQKAYRYITRVPENEYSMSDFLVRAQILCLADKPLRDVDTCTQDISNAIAHKDGDFSNYAVREAITRIVITGEFDKDESQKLSDFIKFKYGLTHTKFELITEKEGLFTRHLSDKFGKTDNYINATPEQIRSHSGDSYCAKFFTIDVEGVDSRRDRAAILVKWTTKQDGKVLSEDFHFLYSDPLDDFNTTNLIESEHLAENKSVKYELEIYDLDKSQKASLSCQMPSHLSQIVNQAQANMEHRGE